MVPFDRAKWRAYQSRITKPRALLIRTIPHVTCKNAALDLGAGSLYDTELLIHEGFKEVIAVDQTPKFREIVAPTGTLFTYIEAQFEAYDFPIDHFDLVSAQYALPFVVPISFEKLWGRMMTSLTEGGIFTGQLFGERDGWRENASMTFHTANDVRRLLSAFDTLMFEEQEYDEKSSRGKHWHYFNIIMRKTPRDGTSR